MLCFLPLLSFAQEPTQVSSKPPTLEDVISQSIQQPDVNAATLILKTHLNDVEHWTGNSPQGYTKALFPTPSLLANLNVHDVAHTLLPTLQEEKTHDFLRIHTESHHITLGFTNGTFNAGLFAIHRSYLQPVASPFQPDRLVNLFQGLEQIFADCAQVQPISTDVYNNAVTWKGEDCTGTDLYARYLPTEEYSLQMIIVSRQTE